jgi:hypothetical protein
MGLIPLDIAGRFPGTFTREPESTVNVRTNCASLAKPATKRGSSAAAYRLPS